MLIPLNLRSSRASKGGEVNTPPLVSNACGVKCTMFARISILTSALVTIIVANSVASTRKVTAQPTSIVNIDYYVEDQGAFSPGIAPKKSVDNAQPISPLGTQFAQSFCYQNKMNCVLGCQQMYSLAMCRGNQQCVSNMQGQYNNCMANCQAQETGCLMNR